MSNRNNKPKGLPKGGAQETVPQQRPSAVGMITPPETVAGLTVFRTIGEDIVFGRCNHALQLLPNQVMLLLVTEEESGGANKVSTFSIGEEVPGFQVEKSLIESLDGTA